MIAYRGMAFFLLWLASPGAGVGRQVEAVYNYLSGMDRDLYDEYIPSRTFLGRILIPCIL